MVLSPFLSLRAHAAERNCRDVFKGEALSSISERFGSFEKGYEDQNQMPEVARQLAQSGLFDETPGKQP